jgi:two-component system response regulator VanR
MRVLVVEDEPYMAEAIRDGLRLEAIAADIAGDGDTALELLSINAYDIAVLDRDIPGPSGDEIAERIVASGSGMPILMLTAADRLDDKASGFELGADDYLTKPFELQELVLRLRALDRRRAHNRPPVREIAGLRLDPFRREVYRDGRYVALTRKQFAVLEVLVAAEGGVVSAEELLERAWDENADPFTNAVRITVSALRKRLGEPWIIATVPASGTASTQHPMAGVREETVDRAPWVECSLKLTLSYAGFLMLAGALLLAAVWVFLLRYVPDVPPAGPPPWPPPPRSEPRRPPARFRLRGQPKWLAFLLVFGLLGGWLLAGRMLAPLTRITGRHTHGRERIALPPNPATRPQRRVPGTRRRLRHHARTARSTRRRTAEIRRQRLARTAHPTGDHADTSRRRPQRSEPRQRRARRTPPRRQRPSDRPHRSTAPAQPRRPASFTREHVDLSLIAEEATETLLPLAEKRGVTIETSGDMPPPSAHTRSCCR